MGGQVCGYGMVVMRYVGKRNLQIAEGPWQITPADMNNMMEHGMREEVDRLTQTILPMKKLDVAALRTAYNGKAGSST